MKLELLNLISQLNMTLEDYQSRRQIMSERKRKWSYFLIFITGFVALPFFGSLFRNINLTKEKHKLVTNMQIKNRNMLIMIKQETSPNLQKYLETISDNLTNVHVSNNLLHEKYNKLHLSKQQLEFGASTAKPSFFQSGLTLAIEKCLKQLIDFQKKYTLSPSSTTQVYSQLKKLTPTAPPPAFNPRRYERASAKVHPLPAPATPQTEAPASLSHTYHAPSPPGYGNN